MIKTLNKLVIDGNFLNLIKSTFQKLTAHWLIVQGLNVSNPRLVTKQGCPLITSL